MNINNEKEIKEYILDLEDSEGYERLDILLNSYFDEVISPLFNALYMLFKNYDANKVKINYIIELLKRFTTDENNYGSEDKLIKISNLIRSLNYKINSNFSRKDRILINNVSYELGELFNSINSTNGRSRILK